MKQITVLISILFLVGCSEKKLNTDGLKSMLEQKTRVTFRNGPKTDSTEILYYQLSTADLEKGLGRFDSAKAACVAYFKDPGTYEEIMGKAFFKWHRNDFYTVLVSALDADSNVIFNVMTSGKPIKIVQH